MNAALPDFPAGRAPAPHRTSHPRAPQRAMLSIARSLPATSQRLILKRVSQNKLTFGFSLYVLFLFFENLYKYLNYLGIVRRIVTTILIFHFVLRFCEVVLY